jgi:hypothetical protein
MERKRSCRCCRRMEERMKEMREVMSDRICERLVRISKGQ